jgi:hypothetical protein
MRIKTLLCLAALTAAGVTASMAQSNVYSLNVVGYVNVPIYGGGQYNMICNPLNNANNSISNLFNNFAQEGDQIFRWDVNAYDFSATTPTYSGGHWANPFTLNPGEGIWYINNNNDNTNTFTGDVVQTTVTQTLVGGGSYNSIGSTVPLGGSFTNVIGGLVAHEGDQVFPWDYTTYDFSTTTPTFSGGNWNHTDFVIPAGGGMIYINNDVDNVWSRTYSVPQTP